MWREPSDAPRWQVWVSARSSAGQFGRPCVTVQVVHLLTPESTQGIYLRDHVSLPVDLLPEKIVRCLRSLNFRLSDISKKNPRNSWMLLTQMSPNVQRITLALSFLFTGRQTDRQTHTHTHTHTHLDTPPFVLSHLSELQIRCLFALKHLSADLRKSSNSFLSSHYSSKDQRVNTDPTLV